MTPRSRPTAGGSTALPGTDFGHLTESTRPLVELDDAARIRSIRSERWIGYPQARSVLGHLETLLSWPDRQRMPNLLLLGSTNNGKSMIIEKFRRTHPPTSLSDREQIPVLCVQMPPEPSPSRFYLAVLAALGTPIRPHSRVPDLERQALMLLRATKVRMLIVDELHNVLAGRDNARREFLNMLRFLGNDLRIPLVGVGTRDAYLAIRTDPQLENRFAPMTLPTWTNTPQARSLMASFAASYPLRQPSHLASPEMTDYLLTRCEGTIGELSTLLTSAAVLAVDTGAEAITPGVLERTEYLGPTERRRQFERHLP
ncbi:TniB family NTP-binding protein [Rhodococcus kroppenstedtii]|uniref:TniB protein n=1 Tax=Rhodococcoides kroppenstedtii TaxID=293050 RepID=A0A1I0T0M8_9NOCA|nr:TniB family NTP-binding protein [Rhodococcus kroppenstedtii]MDV7199465.1 TniB family NTP-binding protein [Rhodococcus kroppenstedtii]SFA45247.1 TniB protein [Rhodococcus kroppenstedtii]